MIASSFATFAQDKIASNNYRVGEKLTYSVSLNSLPDLAYIEFYVASAGKIGDADAVEVRSRFRTLDMAIGAFFDADENRITFLSPETGLPLFSRITDRKAGLPKETVVDNRAIPATEHDLNTLFYAIRNSGSGGSLQFRENNVVYTVTYKHLKKQTVTTEAGTFETNIVSLSSEYFTAFGINELTVHLSADSDRIPVLLRSKTNRGTFQAELSSVTNVVPKSNGTIVVAPIPTPTPLPVNTPKPVPTPTPYIPNQPISRELAFELGETLEYRISDSGREVGSLILKAESRQLVNGKDSLKLVARMANIVDTSGKLGSGGEMIAYVDPNSLAPFRLEIKFTGSLSSFNQTAIFDSVSNSVSFGNAQRIDTPVGTHNILSLFYALRSFNLKPSPIANSPVNDTRVAVFWQDKTTVFTLRPTDASMTGNKGERSPGQLITINTGNPQIDILAPKIWLGNDESRKPLRFSIGTYMMELVSDSKTAP